MDNIALPKTQESALFTDSSEAEVFDVAVIGAGVVGSLIARELTRQGASVVVLEAKSDVAMGATSANSGIVHAGFDAKPGTLKARFNVEGNRMMPALCKELGVKYRNNGSLVVAFSEEEKEAICELISRGEQNGVEGLQVLSREELRAKEPNIGENAVAALYAPTGGIVCPYGLAFAALGNAMDNGAQLITDFAVDAITYEEPYFSVSSSEKVVRARYAVNAAGIYADEVARLIGCHDFTVKPRKGEYMLMDKTCGDLVSCTVFRVPSRLGKGVLVSPTADGNLILGPTAADGEDKTDKSTTAEGLKSIAALACQSVQGIPLRSVITSFSGLRSVGDTGDFIIRPDSVLPRFIHVAAIESPGLTSAPAIACYVAELLQNAGLSVKGNPDFSPIRESEYAFREMTAEQKNAVIAKDKRYGRVVCRCETVTEGEIVEAIHRNPKATTVDGVKRRTRGGMGRCQGGFCGPIVAEILSRELGIPLEQVTKSGGKSYLNVGKTK
ncbi:MAG: NAD(P)/FAD-dependent oxidoreductase [Clostridia bacterium]|nr:NAD(P)/FAD-dependent oxidoreductase [Clostridia bacterium]